MQEPPIHLVGLSHKTAPVGVRECVAVSGPRLVAVLQAVRQEADEVVLVSTCNRSELYLVRPRRDPLELYLDHLGRYPEHLVHRHGRAALAHLFRVAAGLESLVVGEAQILGQVRRALLEARDAKTTGPLLEQAFQRALYVGKRARAETAIGAGAVSVAYAAVDLARAVFGELVGRTAAVIGAGEMAELVLTHFKALGVDRVLVLNRTLTRAQELAARFGGEARPLSALPEALSQADLVVASAAVERPLLGRDQVEAALKGRRRPLFVIDIAVPRNVDPEVGRLHPVYLYDLDALEEVVAKNVAARLAERPRVEARVEEGVADYLEWYAGHLARDRIHRIEEELAARFRAEVSAALAGRSPEEARAIERRLWRVVARAKHALIQLAKDEHAGARLLEVLG